MHIILEGCDNTGKSFLADYLATHLGRSIKSSEGPEKYPGEINERVEFYEKRYTHVPVIFDRHPIISHPIYSSVKNKPITAIRDDLVSNFWLDSPYIIYCRQGDLNKALDGHQEKDYDSPDHMEAVKTFYRELHNKYDQWALGRAHLIYRIGDPMEMVARSVIGAVA